MYRIKALKSFGNVQAGDLGGWVEKEENLSQKGDCWVADEAIVIENAVIANQALITDKAVVSGYASILEGAKILGNGLVSDNARVSGS